MQKKKFNSIRNKTIIDQQINEKNQSLGYIDKE